MVDPHGRNARLGVVLVFAGSLTLSTVSVGGEDTIFLKGRPEGNRGVVIEETDEHVVIRFPRSEIRLIRREALDRPPAPAQERMQDQPGGVQAGPRLEEKAVRSGAVEGGILYQGRGLAGCRVKLIRQIEPATFLEMLKEAETGAEFETVTDEDGFYRFEEVPPGKYLLRWLPPGSDSWIRILSERQYDLIVEKGETATARDIDMSKPVLER